MEKESYLTQLLDLSGGIFSFRWKYYSLLLSLLLLFAIKVSAEDGTAGDGGKNPENSEDKDKGSKKDDISPDQAVKLMEGKFKEVAEELKGRKSGEELMNLYRLNSLVLEFYKDKIGSEVTIPVHDKKETGILTKIRRGTLYVKIEKPKITAVWPLKVKKLPVDFKMKLIGIPEYLQNLYYGLK
jgi:hypothetical protein